jgi:hypothetical protein
MIDFKPDERRDALEFNQELQFASLGGRANRFSRFCSIFPQLEPDIFKGDVSNILDDFNELNGLYRLGNKWLEINIETTDAFVQDFLHWDMTYGVEMMLEERARQLSKKFRGLVLLGDIKTNAKTECRYFVSGGYPSNVDHPKTLAANTSATVLLSNGWNPVTKHVCDRAIIMISTARIGILWGFDND